MLNPLSFLLLAATSISALPTATKRVTICNGREELCSRSYGNTTFLTSHDSFAVSRNPLALGRNQQVDIPTQLREFGVRALQAQSHMKDGVLHFCHTNCVIFDGGPVLNFLQTAKTFLDENPNEVLTFIFTNPEGVSVRDVWDPIFKEAGIADMSFVPPKLPLPAAEWPTLGELIDSGKRVVTFMDAQADPAAVPYILPQFAHVWEPPFSETDPNFPCRVDRQDGPLNPDQQMFMINHNLNQKVFDFRHRRRFLGGLIDGVKDKLDEATQPIQDKVEEIGDKIDEGIDNIDETLDGVLIPAFTEAAETNSIRSIVANSDGCSVFAAGRATSFVMLDWVDIGEGKKAVDLLNGFA